MAARHTGDILCPGADCSRKRKVGRDIAGVQRNDRGHVFRRLVGAQIRTLEHHVMIAQPLCHRPAFLDHMLVDIHADHTAAAAQHLVQVIVHYKTEVGFSAGAVKQHDLLAVILFEHRSHQLNIVVDLVILADHVVLELAFRGQDPDFAQQGCRLINPDQILPSAVQQWVGCRGLFLCCSLPLRLLHLYAARSNRQRDHRAALRIYKHGFVKFLCLLDKKRTEAVCIRWAGAALKPQHIVFLRTRQFGGKFLFSRGERAIRLHKIVAVFIQPRCNTAEQQPELC